MPLFCFKTTVWLTQTTVQMTTIDKNYCTNDYNR